MARLKKSDLIDLALQAIAVAGWTIELLTEPREHPARFRMSRDGVEHLIRLYIWNLSHGGKSRSEHEFRIQITGIEQFELEPGMRTLILGWGEHFGVFAGFDIQHRLGALGSSPSIQVTDATLQAASTAGGAAQDKGDGEYAIAVRPSRLDRYVENLDTVHAGDISSLIEDNTQASDDDLEQSLTALSDKSLVRDFGQPGEDELRADIIANVDSLLGALDESRPAEPGQIGHNQPPEPLDVDTGVAPVVENAAKEIRAELTNLKPNAADIGKAGAKFAWAARLLKVARAEGAKLVEKGKDLAREYAAKALWGTLGTTGVVFKEEIIALLRGLAEAVLRWLQQVTIF